MQYLNGRPLLTAEYEYDGRDYLIIATVAGGLENAAATALELGHHDSRITFAHYRELVRPIARTTSAVTTTTISGETSLRSSR